MVRIILVLVSLTCSGFSYGESYQVELEYKKAEKLFIAKDYKQTLKILKKISSKEYPPANYLLGRLYARGDGIPRNFKTAYNFFHKAAQHGHLDAYRKLALMYKHGDGVKKNLKIANSYFKKASILAESKNKRAKPKNIFSKIKTFFFITVNIIKYIVYTFLFFLAIGVIYNIYDFFVSLFTEGKETLKDDCSKSHESQNHSTHDFLERKLIELEYAVEFLVTL